jgi:pyruvate kinase
MKKIKIICTLGPTSFNKKVLQNLKKQKIDIFRINLSHTNKNNIESRILYLKKNNIKNICLDSEGAQIRTTLCKKKYFLKLNKIIKIFNNDHFSNDKSISMYPSFNITSVKKKTKIYIGFNSLCLEVKKIEKSENYLIAKVIKSGYLESKKGVHINANIKLPALTNKDIYAFKLSKKYKIKYFAISFVNSHHDVEEVKKIVGPKAFIISKIETKNSLSNLLKITKASDALLIDRGDLSRYIPIEQIPIAQEQVIKFTNKHNKPTYVATNLLETMIKETLPTRAESHDIYSTLKQGAKGLVLAAETAIGNDPVGCVKFLEKSINSFFKKKKNLIG